MKARELVFPWPDRKLHPNARVHWSIQAKAKRQAKMFGFAIAKSNGWGEVEWPDGKLHVWIDGYPHDRRIRDADGFLSSLKPCLDGIALAMGINDSRFIPHPWIADEIRKPAEVRIRIAEVPIAKIEQAK